MKAPIVDGAPVLAASGGADFIDVDATSIYWADLRGPETIIWKLSPK